jgi:hypothetical protein
MVQKILALGCNRSPPYYVFSRECSVHFFRGPWIILLRHVFKGQTISKANYGVLNSPKKRMKLTILSIEDAQDSEFCSFFERIEEP